jgi:Fe-S-cluster-containing dehydrogenase component
MAKRLFAFEEICSGCESCVYWCAFSRTKTFNRAESLIKIARDLDGAYHMPVLDCVECKKGLDTPICVEMCPTGALIYAEPEDAFKMRVELHQARSKQPLFKLIAPWKFPYPWRSWEEGIKQNRNATPEKEVN